MRYFTLMLCILAYILPASAQVKVSCDAPEIKVTYKRCIVTDNVAHIDFLITNTGDKTLKAYPEYKDQPGETLVYDDEGNVYGHDPEQKMYIAGFNIGGKNFSGLKWGADSVELPDGIAVKGRLIVNGVDEFATSFTLVKILFRGMTESNHYGFAKIELRDVPITRQ